MAGEAATEVTIHGDGKQGPQSPENTAKKDEERVRRTRAMLIFFDFLDMFILDQTDDVNVHFYFLKGAVCHSVTYMFGEISIRSITFHIWCARAATD